MAIRSKEMKTKSCSMCEKVFNTDITAQKYCSSDCGYVALKKHGLERAKKRSITNTLKFKESYGDGFTGKVTLKCKRCGVDYDRYASSIKHRGSQFCSNKCKTNGNKKAKTKSKLTKELDLYYSRYIRKIYAEDGYVKCVTCGKFDEIKFMQNGHYVSRRFYSTRWDDDNCHPQCYSCNVGLAGNYAAYSLYMIDRYGIDILQSLVKRSKAPYKTTYDELLDKIAYYKGLDK